MTTVEIQQYVYDYLYLKKIPHKTICAIMGNIENESGFNPDIVEVGTQNGLGLCQWSFGRRTQLEKYGTTLEKQCDFLYTELTGDFTITDIPEYQWIEVATFLSFDYSYSNTLFLSGNDTIENLTTAFCWCFERPSESDAHLDKRIDDSYYFYNNFSYGGSHPVPDPGPETKIKIKIVNNHTIKKSDIVNIFGGTFRNFYDFYYLVDDKLYYNDILIGKVKNVNSTIIRKVGD